MENHEAMAHGRWGGAREGSFPLPPYLFGIDTSLFQNQIYQVNKQCIRHSTPNAVAFTIFIQQAELCCPPQKPYCFTVVSHQSFAALDTNRIQGFLVKTHILHTLQHWALSLGGVMCQYVCLHVYVWGCVFQLYSSIHFLQGARVQEKSHFGLRQDTDMDCGDTLFTASPHSPAILVVPAK